MACLCARHVLHQQQLRPNVSTCDADSMPTDGRNASHAIFESFVAECDQDGLMADPVGFDATGNCAGGLVVRGDVVIAVSLAAKQTDEGFELPMRLLFTFAFHTGFVDAGMLRVTRHQLDVWDAPDAKEADEWMLDMIMEGIPSMDDDGAVKEAINEPFDISQVREAAREAVWSPLRGSGISSVSSAEEDQPESADAGSKGGRGGSVGIACSK